MKRMQNERKGNPKEREEDIFRFQLQQWRAPQTGCLLIFDFLRVSQKAQDV